MSRQADHEGKLMEESAAIIESSMVQTLYDFVTKVLVQPEQSNGDVALFTVLDWVKGKTYKPTNIRKLHGELTILIFCKTELCYDQLFADRLLYKAFVQCTNLSRTMPFC